jgi:hypothetical protein
MVTLYHYTLSDISEECRSQDVHFSKPKKNSSYDRNLKLKVPPPQKKEYSFSKD